MSWIKKLLGFSIRGDETAMAKKLALHKAYRRVFIGVDGQLTPDGKLILADLVEKAELTQGQIKLVDGSISVHHTMLREGKREILNGVFRRIYEVPIEKQKNQTQKDDLEFQELTKYLEVMEKEYSTL